MYLIDPTKKQFKANLHCHSVHSDGNLTPQELKDAYKAHGYSVLCITDHEATNDFTHMTEPDFLMLTGYEAFIRHSPLTPFSSEVHLNLFARDPHNTGIVYFHPKSSSFLSDEQKAAVPKIGPLVEREYTTEFVNNFIRCAKENGYIVTYNHPVWSQESHERILSYEGFFSLEIANCSSMNAVGRQEYNIDFYHKLLCSGRQVFAHSADDNHNKYPFDHERNDSFGAFTVVMADKLEYDHIFQAMEKGEMYSSTGPVFHEVSFDGKNVHVSCSDVEQITLYSGSRSATFHRAEPGKTINSATLPLLPGSPFIQVSIRDKDGKHADTRGFFLEELGLVCEA